MKIKYLIVFIIFALIFIMAKHYENQIGYEVWNEIRNSKYTLVIDAGHGGLDGGAVGYSGICEKDITLNISLKSKYLCDFLGITAILTREDENSLDYNPQVSIRENKVSDTRARVDLVNSINDAFLVSIHLNSFTNNTYSGAQIFYNNFSQSEKLANILQADIKTNLDFENQRQALKSPNSVYLIENAKCPAIIYECGFISNQKEEQMLANEEYQTKLAICMVSSFLKIQEEEIYETKNSVFMF